MEQSNQLEKEIDKIKLYNYEIKIFQNIRGKFRYEIWNINNLIFSSTIQMSKEFAIQNAKEFIHSIMY